MVVFIIYTIIFVAPVAYSQTTGNIRGVDVAATVGKIVGGIVGFYFFIRIFFKGKK